MDHFEKGRQVTAEAIENRDPERLRACIERFKSLGATSELITEVIGPCPIDLFADTGLGLKIFSKVIASEFVIGEYLGWEEIKELLKTQPDKEALISILSIRENFKGRIVEGTKRETLFD